MAKTSAKSLIRTGLWLAASLGMLAMIAPLLTRWSFIADPLRQHDSGFDGNGMPKPPGSGFVLGTDSLGRDVLSRVVHGARASLTVGVSAMATATLIGLMAGLLAGYYGGRLDLALMRLTEINMTIPANLLVPMILGAVMFSATVVCAANLTVDLLYVWMDPRIKIVR